MKNLIYALLVLTGIPPMTAQQYILNPEFSMAQWTGYGEVGGFKQKGNIDLKEGAIFVENGTVKHGTIVFDARSIHHENKELKKHLKAKDFFHVRKYPEIIFNITGTSGDQVFGKLTIRDQVKEESFHFAMIRNENLLIYEGKATIDRTRYEIKYNSSSYFQDLGNYAIKNEVDLTFKLVFQAS